MDTLTLLKFPGAILDFSNHGRPNLYLFLGVEKLYLLSWNRTILIRFNSFLFCLKFTPILHFIRLERRENFFNHETSWEIFFNRINIIKFSGMLNKLIRTKRKDQRSHQGLLDLETSWCCWRKMVSPFFLL